ncbi:MAG: RNA polymerase factor sigma-54 [Burkholderiales bacterium]|nr:RNA polymerase factor sigma-54 [Burkholderiales bacterium]
MKHSLQLRLSQQLTLTPQLQQSIRLLQLSTLELNQELETMLQDNPLLERIEGSEGAEGEADYGADETGTDASSGPTSDSTAETPTETRNESNEPGDAGESTLDIQDSMWDDAPSAYAHSDDEEQDGPQMAACSETLREHLLWQLNLLNIYDRDKSMVMLLIDALDDDGYLHQDLAELAALLPPELEVDPVELDTALKHVRNMDPVGVGARSLSECLVLQLESLPEETPGRAHAIEIARNHLAVMAARDFTNLKRLLRCNDAQLREAQTLIVSLNPRPGAEYASTDTRYIVHDVEVRKVKGQWTVRLNTDAMPRLRINRVYADILRRNRNASSKELSTQLQEARWLIKNVQQRFDTILRVSQAIVERQRHFFDHGDVAMRPLVLREIAEEVGLHESTVSRVTTQKYMFTPRGIYELKYFFGSHVATDTGGACSATAIRALIKQLIAAEDTKRPLSDSHIAEVLSQQGIIVARRTIAKYREALQIPPVNLRKSL